MLQPTLAQARVVDPILSEHVRGYRQQQLVGSALFPFAPVPAYGGKVIEFGKEAFKIYNSKRSPGANVKRVQFGYEGKPYAIVPSALDAVVPIEWMTDAAAVPGIDLGKRATNLVMRSLLLEHEVTCATIATNASNYAVGSKVALTSTDVWSHADSDPADDIETGREAIRSKVGMYPNTLVLSATAAKNCRRHPKLIDRSANTGIRKVTINLLKEIFEVENILVGAGVVANDAGVFGDVWGDAAVLAYVGSSGQSVNANAEEPSYGYTYQINGHPFVLNPRYDDGSRSWLFGMSYDNTPVLSGMEAGYLIGGAGD